jgi:hypothetical protein
MSKGMAVQSYLPYEEISLVRNLGEQEHRNALQAIKGVCEPDQVSKRLRCHCRQQDAKKAAMGPPPLLASPYSVRLALVAP